MTDELDGPDALEPRTYSPRCDVCGVISSASVCGECAVKRDRDQIAEMNRRADVLADKYRENGRLELLGELMKFMAQPRTHSEVVTRLANAAGLGGLPPVRTGQGKYETDYTPKPMTRRGTFVGGLLIGLAFGFVIGWLRAAL